MEDERLHYKWAARLNVMVKDLLELSTIQQGLNLKLTTVDSIFFEKWIEIVKYEIEKKNIHFNAVIENNSIKLHVDEILLERALFNIIENSIKFTPSGGKIAVEICTIDNQHIRIAIEDSGIGISPDDLPYIYDRFYKGKSENITGKGGSGLGLAIAKEIIEAHNGTIDILSRYGRGTEIIIIIPHNQKTFS